MIVWDLLFGTWFLPQRARGPASSGCRIPDYPKSFWALMRAPFSR